MCRLEVAPSSAAGWSLMLGVYVTAALASSQCSLHNAPIFRLLLKVAVNGTHQCESFNFCGAHAPTEQTSLACLLLAKAKHQPAMYASHATLIDGLARQDYDVI